MHLIDENGNTGGTMMPNRGLKGMGARDGRLINELLILNNKIDDITEIEKHISEELKNEIFIEPLIPLIVE
jgi:hypothetical protein